MPVVLEALRTRGVKIAVVSDIHFDLRPEFEAAGLDACVGSYVLSFEQGFQKPDRRMFQIAIDELGVEPVEPPAAVMFGDRASRDGGAAALGIPTIILPPLLSVGDRRLERFLSLWESD